MATKSGTLKGVKPGHYIMIDDEPCKVVSVSLSKPGKHGSTKARVDAVGLFDSRKRSLLKPADATVQVPIIEKKKAQVISITGDFVQLMDMEEYNTFDANVPAELKGKLQPGEEVGYWKIGKNVIIKAS
ncbi:MAG: translation initiation factor IF-5A [Candidatus Aenigmatarchaeota archaeon]|nr:MAG: translation initiation factor IF-5A [Candidatus Aenigmarchaeota archaeon]